MLQITIKFNDVTGYQILNKNYTNNKQKQMTYMSAITNHWNLKGS